MAGKIFRLCDAIKDALEGGDATGLRVINMPLGWPEDECHDVLSELWTKTATL